jgi:hypothetical protein
VDSVAAIIDRQVERYRRRWNLILMASPNIHLEFARHSGLDGLAKLQKKLVNMRGDSKTGWHEKISKVGSAKTPDEDGA